MNQTWIAAGARTAGILAMIFYTALVLVQLVRYFATALGLKTAFGVRLAMPRRLRARPGRGFRAQLLAAFLLSRLFVLAVCALYAAAEGGFAEFRALFWDKYWCRWDADHYIGLIENWYVAEGDAQLHLVFFPLYPLVCRGLCLLGLSAEASAMIVSNGALLGCGELMGRLTAMHYGKRNASRAVWLLMFCPVTFFFSMPYTESLFLLVTLASVLAARHRRYGWAVFFGAMAANARMVGMAAAIPIFWELLRDAWRRYAAVRGAAARRTDRAFLLCAGVCVLKVLPVLLGFAAYLALNYSLHGNAFQFLIYQEQNWSQQMGTLAETVRYTMINALTYKKWTYRFGVWIPQIITIFGTIALMAATWRRQHPGDAAYALVYFYLSVAPTWLLSGTRYTMAMYALIPMLLLLPARGRRFIAAMTVELVLLAYMSIMGVNIGFVL